MTTTTIELPASTLTKSFRITYARRNSLSVTFAVTDEQAKELFAGHDQFGKPAAVAVAKPTRAEVIGEMTRNFISAMGGSL